ncbi:MAG: carbamoyl-phosphate synthase (glutamine-hydrolyzing) large subunit [Candidatus Lokiarchaeota archaeon]|nr:carbamoyl-phosphate synthase (glutamine-hydrolyzing) large subunit [Candidatus Lokiarchaeota archaeon]
MPKFPWLKKCIVLGSGAIKIGQAGEFDYSGTQCIKAVKEEGIEVVLINANIATVQTDPQVGKLADRIYLLPITEDYVEEVIKKERPDAILLGFGGQNSLNVGVNLDKAGVFEKYNCKVIGTPISAIDITEDRELFRQAMNKVGAKIADSGSATTVEQAIALANRIGYPVMIRVGYTLGGKGSGVANNEQELIDIASRGIKASMIKQVLIEQDMTGWREIEYEICRDYDDNCMSVCNMENFDPVGIHTGESIVVAPSQTLNNREVQIMRKTGLDIIRSIGIVGECNIQYALHPTSEEFRVIEINPRLSRSSALASKATGYPLAYIAAKMSIGYMLPELINQVTKKTTACFEPALDYLVLKLPRWNMEKFQRVSRKIGTQMKSVGEVMAIGRTFEEVLQKAIRMLDNGKNGLVCNKPLQKMSNEELREEILHPCDNRVYWLAEAFKRGFTVDELYELSKIERWFLFKLKNIVDHERELRKLSITDPDEVKAPALRLAKILGFSDKQIAMCLKTDELIIRRERNRLDITPVVKQIDTLAAEFPASTNYLYMTYCGHEDDIDFTLKNPNGKKIIVLGSGVYRIGSSVEFDWGCVNMAWALKQKGIDEVIMVNYNPETVSTDYNESDKLYFEELSLERVLDIIEKESPFGIVVSVGGQVSNNLAPRLVEVNQKYRLPGIKILGTEGKNIDRAEDREKFSNLLDHLGIIQPSWRRLFSVDEAIKFANGVRYPVIVRPSYVLSGAAMRVAYNEKQLREFLELAVNVTDPHMSIVISKFIENSREVEIDAVADGDDVFIGAIMEHVENAGVHSGDADTAIPTFTISDDAIKKIVDNTRKIAGSLQIKVPFNIQYIVDGDDVFVIECNLRSSRSMPFVSKTRGINLMKLAAEVLLGGKLRPILGEEIDHIPHFNYYGVKVPQFSFMRLSGADPILGVEMVSTGEVACLGMSFEEALLKSLIAAEFDIPLDSKTPDGKSKVVLITVGGGELKQQLIPIAKRFEAMGFKIYATEHTAQAFLDDGIKVTTVYKINEFNRKPNIMDCLLDGTISLLINIPMTVSEEKLIGMLEDEYQIRRKAVEYGIPVLTNMELVSSVVTAIETMRNNRAADKQVVSLNEYFKMCDRIYW